MELREYLTILAKRWQLATGAVLFCLAAALGVTLTLPSVYQAQTQLFVSVRGSANVSELSEAGDFSQERVQSYADVATSPRVTQPVISTLGLDVTPAQLAEQISVEAPPETVLLEMQVEDRSPVRAALIANAVSQQLVHVIETIEAPRSAKVSPIKVSITRKAVPPASPASPKPLLIIGLGLVLGIVGGTVLAVLREGLDKSVKTPDDLSGAAELPVLGTIPHDAGARNPIVRETLGNPRVEAIRRLRTNLQFADVDRKPAVVMVGSALQGEGKSSVAGNLARALTQLDLRVCLVDGDLRSPCVADYFGLVAEAGLTNVLVGQATVRDVLQPAGSGLDVLASGIIPPNPSELLASESMASVLHELRERYDMVIVDTPPLLPVTDAAVLSPRTDGALLVVRAGKTSKAQVTHAVAALHNTGSRILGCVLNMAPPRGRDAQVYGYGYVYRASSVRTGSATEESTPVPSEDPTPTPPAGLGPIW